MRASMKSQRQGGRGLWAADERHTVGFDRWAFAWVPVTLAKVGSMQNQGTERGVKHMRARQREIKPCGRPGGRSGGRMGGQDSGRRRLQGCGQDSRCQAGHAYPETRRSFSDSRPAPDPREKSLLSILKNAFFSLVADPSDYQVLVRVTRSPTAPKRTGKSPKESSGARGGRGPG